MASRLSLAARLYSIFALFALLTAAIAVLSDYNSRRAAELTQSIETANLAALNVERVNSLVYAVVMESRGIYMSPDWKTAQPFAKKLLKDLDGIDATAKLWKEDVIESEREKIDHLQKSIAQFIAFRKELVRKAEFEDTASARAFGDNDANRTVRSALNDELVALGKDYAGHTTSSGLEVKRINSLNATMLFSLAGLAAIALTIQPEPGAAAHAQRGQASQASEATGRELLLVCHRVRM